MGQRNGPCSMLFRGNSSNSKAHFISFSSFLNILGNILQIEVCEFRYPVGELESFVRPFRLQYAEFCFSLSIN